MSMHAEDINKPALVIKCAFDWRKGELQLEACEPSHKACLACKIDETLSPSELRETAVKFAAYVEIKYPGKWNIGFHSYLNQQYYTAKKSWEAQKKRSVITFQPPKPPVHICELQGGEERGSEGIPGDGLFEAWRTWDWDETLKRLTSPSHQTFVWEPLQVVEATCTRCPAPPCTRCTCGIYAGTEEQSSQYGEVLGMLKQWGRFVKGATGVKSQFAYPAWFLLKSGQEPLIDELRIYGVPIKMMTPIVVWDPKEDGFATPGQEEDNNDEYRGD